MSKLQEVHAKDYADMPFEEFAQRYHQKFYSDVPFDAFMERAGGVRNEGGQKAAVAPPRQAIREGDWAGLKGRIDERVAGLQSQYDVMPQDIPTLQQDAARDEGLLYGRRNASRNAASRAGEFVGRTANSFALGLPRLAEAYMPAVLGGQSELPGSVAHEFIKAADEGRQSINPNTALAGDVVGTVGQVLAGPAAGAGRVAGSVGLKAVEAAAKAKPALDRILTGAGLASILGAGASAVDSRADLGETARGGGVGLAFGLGGGAVGEGLVKAGRAVLDPIKGVARSGPVDDQAAARIMLAAKNEGVTPQSLATRRAELGDEMFLADALGMSGESMVRTAGNVSPKARSVVESAYGGRVAGQTDRLMDALQARGGLTERLTPDELTSIIRDQSRPAVRAAYKSAEDAGYALDPSLFGDLTNAPSLVSALNKARATTKDRIVTGGADEGSQLALWDATKKILDGQASVAFRAGDTEAGARLSGLAKALRDRVDDNIPEYGGARDMARAAIQRGKAVELGAEGFGRRADGAFPRMVEASGLPADDIARGYSSAAINELGKRKAGQLAVDELIGTKNAEAALRAALGKNADDVIRQAKAEQQFVSSKNAVLGGPDTARKLTEIQLATMGAGAGAGGGYALGFDPATTGGLTAALILGRRGLEKFAQNRRLANESEVAPRLVEILTGQSMPKLTREETQARSLIESLIRNSARGGAIGFAQ